VRDVACELMKIESVHTGMGMTGVVASSRSPECWGMERRISWDKRLEAAKIYK